MKVGRFSFRPPIGYDVQVQGAKVMSSDEGGTIFFGLVGAQAEDHDYTSAENLADRLLEAVFKRAKRRIREVRAY